MTTPESLDLSAAADYLLVCLADRIETEKHGDREEERPARAAYYAALDLWQALTGLTGEDALDYARTVRDRNVTAHVPPF